ncbi:MAG: helix-turn-helix domain-containing protein [Maricaulaceae bacterium]
MDFVSNILGYGSLVMLALLAVLDCRDCKTWTQRVIFTGLCLSTAAYLVIIQSQPWIAAPMPIADWFYQLMAFVHVPNIVFIWLFGLLIFRDNFRLKLWHYIVIAGFIVPALILCGLESYVPYQKGWPSVTFGLYGFSLIGHLIFVIARGYNHDLIHRRRRMRLVFITVMIAITAGILLAEMGILPLAPNLIAQIQVAAIFMMVVWVFFWMVQIDDNRLFFNQTAVDRPPSEPLLDARDMVLKAKLLGLMDADKLFMQAGLTIPALAEQLGTSEHRLRRVINQGLGYRNFSAFLNTYRITAIKAALSDPTQANLPILTLAMDYGYSSLAPFNRAFRDAEGLTPSEYRQKALQSR